MRVAVLGLALLVGACTTYRGPAEFGREQFATELADCQTKAEPERQPMSAGAAVGFALLPIEWKDPDPEVRYRDAVKSCMWGKRLLAPR